MSLVPPFPARLNSTTASIPRISLAKLEAGDEVEAARLFQACIDVGCFSLDLNEDKNGAKFISNIDEAFSIGQTFFDTPLENKSLFPRDGQNIGYKPIGAIKSAAGSSDNVEMFSLSQDRLFGSSNTSLPSQFSDKRAFLTSLVQDQLAPLSRTILKHIAAVLEIPASTFEALHSNTISSGTVLRFLHYPVIQSDSSTDEGRAKLLGHTDNGSLTILFTQLGGLQILPANADEIDSTSSWEWVKPEPGCAFVNVGDSLVQWTGGVLRSVYHRVVRPPLEQADMDRYSFGYFLKPADTASMQQLQQGLIPKVAEEDEKEQPTYKNWHMQKTAKLMNGINGMSRGGNVPIKWNKKHLATAQPITMSSGIASA